MPGLRSWYTTWIPFHIYPTTKCTHNYTLPTIITMIKGLVEVVAALYKQLELASLANQLKK
jgi:hypothetical protein